MTTIQARFGQPGVYNATLPDLPDGIAGALQLDSKGRVIFSPGSGSSAYAVDDSAMPATPAILPVGGEYRASATTYADGDATVLQSDINGNAKTTLATGLNKTDDSVTNYPVGCNVTIVDLATDADVVVTASPAYLVAFRVDTVMSAHAALIKDNTTTMITIAASSAANYNENCYNAIFATNITVESDNAATGKVAVFWRAI